MIDICWGKVRLVACGALLSTLGYRIVRSTEAKKLYTLAAAAVLREKEYIMTGLTDIREDCEDILADAKEVNECYAEAHAKVIEDRAARREAEAEAKAEAEAEAGAEAEA